MNWNAYRQVQATVREIDEQWAARRKAQKRVAARPSRYRATHTRPGRAVVTVVTDRSAARVNDQPVSNAS
jgi:hypothetical protein